MLLSAEVCYDVHNVVNVDVGRDIVLMMNDDEEFGLEVDIYFDLDAVQDKSFVWIFRKSFDVDEEIDFDVDKEFGFDVEK